MDFVELRQEGLNFYIALNVALRDMFSDKSVLVSEEGSREFKAAFA